jgi:hypothetical protein
MVIDPKGSRLEDIHSTCAPESRVKRKRVELTGTGDPLRDAYRKRLGIRPHDEWPVFRISIIFEAEFTKRSNTGQIGLL